MAAAVRRAVAADLRRSRQTSARHAADAPLLRRTLQTVWQRRLQRCDGCVVCRRELGGCRILEGAHFWAREDQGEECSGSSAGLLYVARQDRRSAQGTHLG